MRPRYVDQSVWADIERLQPFKRREKKPESDEFAMLDELWNTHKHRHLPLVESWVGLDKVFSTAGDLQRALGAVENPEINKHRFDILVDRIGPFIDGAEVGRVRESRSPKGYVGVRNPQGGTSNRAVRGADLAGDQGRGRHGPRNS